MRFLPTDKMCCVLEVVLVLCVTLGCVTSVPLRLFYPYGELRGDATLQPADDSSSSEIQLSTPVHFYDGFFNSLFVSILKPIGIFYRKQ